jgi:hypothetical protein
MFMSPQRNASTLGMRWLKKQIRNSITRVKFIRGKDHDIKPGSVWMIKAEIAKRLTANSPDLWLTPNDLTCSKR